MDQDSGGAEYVSIPHLASDKACDSLGYTLTSPKRIVVVNDRVTELSLFVFSFLSIYFYLIPLCLLFHFCSFPLCFLSLTLGWYLVLWLSLHSAFRITWNVDMMKQVIPLERFGGVVVSHGVGYTQACMGMTSFSDVPAADSGVSVVGEIRLMPDMTTKRRLPW
jgi:hypothetical protein